MTNLPLFVSQGIPEHLRTDYPKFVEFLQAYYKFHSQYLYDLRSARDVAETSDLLLAFLKREFAAKFPKAVIDDRKFIIAVRQLYQLKGTLDAVKLLFKLFFNEAITIHEPGKNILRASDGKWIQTSFIRVEWTYNNTSISIPAVSEIKSLRVVNDIGTFFLEVDRVEDVGEGSAVFYYQAFNSVPFSATQTVEHVSQSGELYRRGVIVPQPATLRIVQPGKYWRLGQIIRVPGTNTDTIARVTAVGDNGFLRGVEVADYGFDHTENQVVVVSPFASKPQGASYDITSTINGYNAATDTFSYNHVLTVDDFTDSIEEEVSGSSDVVDSASYFLENYTERGYTSKTEFYQKSSVGASSINQQLVDPNVTIAMWLESRATLVFERAQEVKLRGYYLNEDGQLSSPGVRLQDNYFYQLFSYVIESQQPIQAYRNVLNQVHPAGLAQFGELNKTAKVNIDTLNITRTLSRNTVYFTSNVVALDGAPRFTVTKSTTSPDISSVDSVPVKSATIVTSHGVAPQDNPPAFGVTSALTSPVVSMVDQPTNVGAALSLAHGVAINDSAFTANQTIVLSHEASVSDASIAKTLTLNTTNDAASPTDVGATTTIDLYDVEQYFAENYVAFQQTLTVG